MRIEQFAEKYRFFGKTEKTLEAWMVGYDIMQNMWDTYAQVPPAVRKSVAFQLKTAAVMRPPQVYLEERTGLEAETTSEAQSIDTILANSNRRRKTFSNEFHDRVNEGLDDKDSFEEFIAELVCYHPQILESFTRNNGQIPQAVLYETVPGQIFDIHLGKPSLNPRTSWERIKADLAKLKQNPPKKIEWVRGVSWLITPEKRTLQYLGLGEEVGTQFFYPDINGIVDGSAVRPKNTPASSSELLNAALGCVKFASISDFMIDGRLPDVGVAMIPASAFFEKKPSFMSGFLRRFGIHS